MKKGIMVLTASLSIVLMLVAFSLPLNAKSQITGSVDFYQVTSGTCSSSNPTWSTFANGGVGPVPSVTSNGPAGLNDPLIDEGASICVVVNLNALSPGTQTVTSPGFGGSFTVNVDSNGHGTGSGILTDNVEGVLSSCGTHPLKITGSAGPGGQIYHVLLATTSGLSGCSGSGGGGGTSVPEFPLLGSLGLLFVLAISIPLLFAARKWRSPIRVAQVNLKQ